jgi:Ca2+-binding EF-hand superfamily protein
MKLKKLIIVSTTVLLSAGILPVVNAQDTTARAERAIAAIDVRPQRSDGEGAVRHRSRPGGAIDRLFGHLDGDEDGFVSEDEFLDARLARVDNQFDRRDEDGDGLISEEEADRRGDHDEQPDVDREAVIACVRETIADWEGPHEVEDRFDEVDLDGDGFIDLVELSIALEERAFVLFDRIDTNNDGLISLEEVEVFQDDQINLRRVIRACIDEVSDPFEATL